MNQPAASKERPNGVIEGVGSFGIDLAMLAALQARLAACDLRESLKRATPALVGLTVLVLIAGASLVVGLIGMSLWLAAALETPASRVMMLVALAGLVVAALPSVFLVRALPASFSCFRRSSEELERNIAWIKTTLVHSGR